MIRYYLTVLLALLPQSAAKRAMHNQLLDGADLSNTTSYETRHSLSTTSTSALQDAGIAVLHCESDYSGFYSGPVDSRNRTVAAPEYHAFCLNSRDGITLYDDIVAVTYLLSKTQMFTIDH
jgi:hypothetical protein